MLATLDSTGRGERTPTLNLSLRSPICGARSLTLGFVSCSRSHIDLRTDGCHTPRSGTHLLPISELQLGSKALLHKPWSAMRSSYEYVRVCLPSGMRGCGGSLRGAILRFRGWLRVQGPCRDLGVSASACRCVREILQDRALRLSWNES